MDPNQRERRQEKRLLKRQGNQRVRRQLKRDLAEHPEEAHRPPEPDYGRFRSAPLNGLDHDTTRARPERTPPTAEDPAPAAEYP